MPESETWPKESNTLADPRHIQAIGQFALLFNYAEAAVEEIFLIYFPTEKEYSENLFVKLSNRDRVDLLCKIAQRSEKNPTVLGLVLDGLRFFDICTDNRNIVMHATNDMDAQTDIIRFAKRARNNPKITNWYDVSLEDMRRVADDAAATFLFLFGLYLFLKSRAENRLPWTLPDRPPQPYRLSPSPQSEANAT
jgi:hypothetical protein